MPEKTPAENAATQNESGALDPAATASLKPELSSDDRLKILYETFFEDETSSKTDNLYKLSWAQLDTSGLSFGVNQLDMGQAGNKHVPGDLRKRVDAYVLANPTLNLSTLTPDDEITLGSRRISRKPLTTEEKAHNKKLETLRDNKAIASYLASAAGHDWVESNTGSYVEKNILEKLVKTLGGSELGKKILNDPEMLSLVGEALNNTGHISELGKLPETGSAQFRRNKPKDQFTLTDDERRDGVGVDRLREMLQHEYVRKATIVDLNRFGAPDDDQPERLRKSTYTNAARHIKDLFEHQSLPSPPEKFLHPDPDLVARPKDEPPLQPQRQPRPRARCHSELQQWPPELGDDGVAPGSFDIAAAESPDIPADPKASRDLASLVFPQQVSRDTYALTGLVSEFKRPPTTIRLLADATDQASDESWDGSYRSSLPAPLLSQPEEAETPRPDYDRITREVMRRIADEGNRPPRGILFDPSATVPFMAS
jgi:hypothetical protein